MMSSVTESTNSSFFATCKRIIALALPMGGTQLINVASSFLCMAMIAALGHDTLAASALIYTTQLSIMVIGMSLLFSISVLIGNANGAKEYASIGSYVQQGWLLALLVSIPIMLIFWNIADILHFFGQDKKITDIVQTYFHAYLWSVIPALLSTCNYQLGFGIHKNSLMVFMGALSVIVLLFFAYALIFGKFFLPKLGVAGLGFANFFQYTFFFIITTFFFYYQKGFARFELFHFHLFQHLDHFTKMFKIGWPICVQVGGEMLSFFVSGLMVGWLGLQALAAFQIVNQYYFLIVIPIFSLAQASSILIGFANGAKQFNDIKKLSYASIILVLIASSIVAFIFLFLPKQLASFYLDVANPAYSNTLHITIVIFAILAISQLFDSVRNVIVGILRGLFDTRFTMYMSLFSIWIIGMPLSYLLAFPLHFGIIGFVVGGMIGMLIGLITMYYRMHIMLKKYETHNEN